MPFDDHLRAIEAATTRFATSAAAAGPDAAVLTCPGWSVRDLIAHQGAVHRWATANVVGDSDTARDYESLEEGGRSQADPVAWLLDGAAVLVSALERAPADLEALVFLKDPASPREFWARRQCHETTIHAVDALSAHRGRMPSARLAEIPSPVAVDGLDELLTGFLPRRKSLLRASRKQRIAVRPREADAAWLVVVSDEPVVTTRHTGSAVELDDADATFTGTAAELYLGLWNRSEEVASTEPEVLARWRELARVT